jgi:hypothetical protein
MPKMLPALPMLRIEPELPMLRIEPALPMDSIEPTLPMLRTLPKLGILPTLPKLKILKKLLALSGPARLTVLMSARLRLRLERVDLRIINSSVFGTSSFNDASQDSLTAPPDLSPHCNRTVATTGPAGASPRSRIGPDLGRWGEPGYLR